jgi:small-conductance mechanosensitive channel
MFSAEPWQGAICKSATARFTAVLIAIAGLALPILHAQAQQNTPQTNLSQPPETGAASREAAPTADSTDPAAPIDFHEAWFPVDSLNAGLSEPGEPLNRATPRATLESFLNLAANQEFGRAAHLFNLALIPRQEQPEQGPELARKLHEIFNRRVWINWNNLPDRPDAMEVIGAQSNQTAGEPRRSLSIASLQLDDRSVTLRLSRLKAPDRPPLWLFSAQTVGNIDALYERYGPGWLEQRLPEWLKRTGPGAIPLWKLLVLPLLLGVAVLAAWGVYRGTQMIARIGRPEWVCLIIRKSGAPLAFLTACLFGQLVIGTMLPLSGPVNSIVQPVLLTGIIAAIAWLALRGFDTILDFASKKYVSDIGKEENDASRRLYTNLSVARRVALLIAFLAAAGLLFSQLELFQTLGVSLLASAGIFSLIFGFAAQTVLGNILASLQIAISKPVRIGDSIFYEGQWGNVEEINYTYILIRIWDDRRLVVPVQYFVSHPFENWSIKTSHLLGTINIKMDHRVDVDALREKFTEIVQENENWDGKVEPQTLVTDHDDEGMTVRFYASAENASKAWYLECAMREQMLAFVRGMKDAPAYPHRRVLIEHAGNGEERLWREQSG